jgi:hypothetical protein
MKLPPLLGQACWCGYYLERQMHQALNQLLFCLRMRLAKRPMFWALQLAAWWCGWCELEQHGA